jgi:hypothetical protein
VPLKSGFYEQVTWVKLFLSFPSWRFCLCWLLWCRVVILPRVSIRTLSEPLGALCGMGSEGEVDAASFRPTL